LLVGADYIPEKGLVVTSANDNSLNFWDAQTYVFKERISTPEIQMTGFNFILFYFDLLSGKLIYLFLVKWCSEYKLLYSGGSDAVIHAYDVDHFKERKYTEGFNVLPLSHKKKNKENNGHTAEVLDLLPIPKQRNPFHLLY